MPEIKTNQTIKISKRKQKQVIMNRLISKYLIQKGNYNHRQHIRTEMDREYDHDKE